MRAKCLAVFALAATAMCGPVFAKTVIGWVDRVKLYPGGIALHARMDSGAQGSSLRADSMQRFQRGGQPWLRLEIVDRRGRPHTLEAPVARHIRIKRHTQDSARRPVIDVGLCVGAVYKEVQASVTVRSHLNYPVLVGRDFLAGDFIIDSGRTFTARPHCKSTAR